jgi:hypothetical protein
MDISHDIHAAFKKGEELEVLEEKLLDSFIETIEEAIPTEHRRKIVKTLLTHFIK